MLIDLSSTGCRPAVGSPTCLILAICFLLAQIWWLSEEPAARAVLLTQLWVWVLMLRMYLTHCCQPAGQLHRNTATGKRILWLWCWDALRSVFLVRVEKCSFNTAVSIKLGSSGMLSLDRAAFMCLRIVSSCTDRKSWCEITCRLMYITVHTFWIVFY